MDSNPSVIHATGRRKNAVASVNVTAGTGSFMVNGREFKHYFPSVALRNYALQPLTLTNMDSKVNVQADLTGGGVVGQAGALRHGLARALVRSDPSLRDVIKRSGFLTRDARMKERKKSGQPGARKRFQFSKR